MRAQKNKIKKIGVIGTGFIAKGFALALERCDDLVLSKTLTRRPIRSCKDYPGKNSLTNSVEELIGHSDIVLECSGDAVHATDVIDKVLKAKKPVVTMNTEFHVTTGSYFVGKGMVTEAEGDQPGCLAALHENVTQMGFKPLVYGNVKGFHNADPTLEDMRFWSGKQGISLPMVTASTDGTKVQFEQALVANCFGAAIVKEGMSGLRFDDVTKGAFELLAKARKIGRPVSDYVINGQSSIRVFIVAEGDPRQKESLSYLKMGDGPGYLFRQDVILCHLEIVKTVRRVLNGGGILLDNSKAPTVSIAALAKHDIPKGHQINHPIGRFDIRGEAVIIKNNPDHVPLGLLSNIVFKRAVEKGQKICWDDVEVPDSLALRAWRSIKRRILK